MGNTFIKITMGLTATVAAISCGTAAIAARGGNAYRSGECSNTVECTEVCFTDNDGDGICDNRGTGNGCGKGQGFVDEDNDGVCDNRGTGCANVQSAGHHGNGRGHHGHR